MKFRVTMKDPDTLHDACREAAEKSLGEAALDDDEREVLIEKRQEKYAEIAAKWFEYGEYVTIEIDTNAKTATVVERNAP